MGREQSNRIPNLPPEHNQTEGNPQNEPESHREPETEVPTARNGHLTFELKNMAALHNEPDKSKQYTKQEERTMLKNVIMLSVVFTILFTSYSGMSRLQSSINAEEGLGVYSLATTYGTIVLTAMFIPTYVIEKLSVKYAIFYSILGYLTYIAAGIYPTFWTLIPTAAIVGISGGPLWAAKSIYLTKVANAYAALKGEKADAVIVRYFGIFFFTFQTAGVWGNLIAIFILSAGAGSQSDGHDDPFERDISHCGSSFCPADAQQGKVLVAVSDETRYVLGGVYLAIGMVSAILCVLFLDSLEMYGEPKSGTSVKSAKETFSSTFIQMKNPLQLLILPLTLWSGIEQGFIGSDYFQAYVTCAWGVENLGYIGICFAACNAMASICLGTLTKWTGRVPVFFFGALLNSGTIFVLFQWTADANNKNVLMLFIIAGVWGIADAVWQTQLNALYGVLFSENEEAAFSIFRLWQSIGFIIAYVNGNLLCVSTKLHLLSGILSVGMVGYVIIEILTRLKDSKKKNCSSSVSEYAHAHGGNENNKTVKTKF